MNAQVKMPEFIEAAKERVEGLILWRKHIEKALSRNNSYMSYTEICQMVLAGKLLWFANEASFAIAEIIILQKGPYCHINIAGGDYVMLCELEETQVVPFLKTAGITRITTLGRDGFLRRKRPNGWKPTRQQFFVKEI